MYDGTRPIELFPDDLSGADWVLPVLTLHITSTQLVADVVFAKKKRQSELVVV